MAGRSVALDCLLVSVQRDEGLARKQHAPIVAIQSGARDYPTRDGGMYPNAYPNQPDSEGVHGCLPMYSKRADLRGPNTRTCVRTWFA